MTHQNKTQTSLIQEYTTKMIDNLPSMSGDAGLGDIDLVMDGGMFNGSFLIGSLFFIREMEARQRLRVSRISTVSVSSIVGLFYLLHCMDELPAIYDRIFTAFSTEHTLFSVLPLFFAEFQNLVHAQKWTDADVVHKLNGRFYVAYYNVETRQKMVQSYFRDIAEVEAAITRSCFIPWIMDGSPVVDRQFIDGISPFVFSTPIGCGRVLYLSLFGMDKWQAMFDVKGEQNNMHRILSGVLDAHHFFMKGCRSPTSICSFVDRWNWWHHGVHRIRRWLEEIFVAIMCLLVMNILPCFSSNTMRHLCDTAGGGQEEMDALRASLRGLTQDLYSGFISEFCL